MKAKEFEDVCLYRMRQEEAAGRATMGRYGVQGVMLKGDDGQMKWQPIASLPDFEGVLPPHGRQFTFDCKVCNQASFPLDEDKFKKRQLKHMLTRAAFGVVSFLLIHFPERVMVKSTQECVTYAFPVYEEHPFWSAFDRGEVKRITREDCQEYAVRVEWNVLEGGRTPRPDILSAIHQLAGQPAA